MKILFSSLLVVLVFSNVYSQTAKPVKDDYFEKSKRQNKVGKILFFGGGTLIAIALVYPKGKYTGSSFLYGANYKNDDLRVAIGTVGVVSILGSIPFFLSSRKNNRKSINAAAGIYNQKILFSQQNTFVIAIQPSLGIKVAL